MPTHIFVLAANALLWPSIGAAMGSSPVSVAVTQTILVIVLMVCIEWHWSKP